MLSPSILIFGLFWLAACAALPVMQVLDIAAPTRAVYSNALQIGSAALSALLCYYTALVFAGGQPLRKVWVLLGSGVLAWGAGALLYALYQFAHQGQEPPYPWYSDIGYLLMVPLIVAGLAVFVRSFQIRVPPWGLAAGVLVFLGALALAFASSLGNLKDADSGIAYAVIIAYMVLDPLLLAMTVISASLLAGGLAALPWWIGLSGLTLYYLGNLAFNYQVAQEQYATGGLVDITWPLAFALIALAGLLTRRMMQEDG